MTTVAIHSGPGGFHEKWAEFLSARGARVKRVNLLGADALAEVRDCHGVMWNWYHDPDHKQHARTLLHVLETELGLPAFPNLRTAWHFDNKIAQHYLFRALDIPTPDTWLFWKQDEALAWLDSARYPLVFKLASGAGSSHVEKVDHARRARRLVRKMFSRSGHLDRLYMPPGASRWVRMGRHARNLLFRVRHAPAYALLNRYPPLPRQHWKPEKNYALFQEFLPDNPFDTRITVIGDRAFGYRRMNRPADFRASGSGVFDPNPDLVDRRCIEVAFAAASKLKTQSVAFDLLFRRGQPVVLEISYAYVDWMVQACPGHWDRGLNWHPGAMWPEEAHVIDFLREIAERFGTTGP
jgi:hypothetical protein